MALYSHATTFNPLGFSRHPPHDRCSLAYASVERFGAAFNPRCTIRPNEVVSPPQISRREWAEPRWQKSMATN